MFRFSYSVVNNTFKRLKLNNLLLVAQVFHDSKDALIFNA